MKVLYVAGRWDPRIQDEYSGNDYGAYHSIKKQSGVQLELVGPFNFPPALYERIYWKFPHLFKKRLLKHPVSYLKKCASNYIYTKTYFVLKKALALDLPILNI